ncbi:bifunctional folylpolyglutamate synthase/dihydrofolate synthase [Desertibaculum subflavum]|uniref:bifunctional folylpolyglutamate synthase/dihydrofolate synthase n=1 Tax=Desertibaculum subflavum TaxID=2268458 RepID=UPI000E67642A
MPPPRHDLILARLRKLHPRLIDLSLGRMHRILATLGHPERQLPPVIHVAGTNGKGSLIAYLRAMLEAAGYRVHAFTSPHLVRFNERIRLAGRLIEDAELEAVLEAAETANAGLAITEFEIVTAAALLAFARHPGDVLLLETGLGGNFDSTNVVDRPALTAITPIDFDHMEFLGRTLPEIATAKAGILKPGVIGVIGPQRPEAAAVIAAAAARIGAPLFRRDGEFQVERLAEGFRYRDAAGALDLPAPVLPGDHQIDNAATAVACARRLDGFRLDAAAIAAGLTAADWPARLQRLRRGPLVDALPEGEIWLDGGHNPHGARAAAAFLRSLPSRPTHLIVAAKANRDAADLLAPFVGLAAGVVGIAIPGDPNCHPPEAIVAAAAGLGMAAAPAADPAAAMAIVAARAASARLLITGSLYLAGAILAANG